MIFDIFFALFATPNASHYYAGMCIDHSSNVCRIEQVQEKVEEKEDRVTKSEQFMLKTKIKYCRGGAGPKCYDCSGILTEALRAGGWEYKEKMSSSSFYRNYEHVPFKEARRGDILVTHDGKTHVALITEGYKNGKVTVLDYVKNHSTASYRKYSKIPDTVIVRLK